MSQPPYEPPAAEQPEEPTPPAGSAPPPQGAPPPPQEPPPASPYSPPPPAPQPPPPPAGPGQPSGTPVAPYGPPPEGSWQPAGTPPWPSQGVRRYERRVVLISAAITVVALIAMTIGAGTLPAFFPFGLFAVPILLVVSIVLTIVTKDVRQRSIWLGVLIGIGVALIVGGGLCIAIIASLGY